MYWAAFRTCISWPRVVGLYEGMFTFLVYSEGSHSSLLSATSSGMSTSTGPGRPVRAMWNASESTLGSSSPSFTRKLCLVMGMVMPDEDMLDVIVAIERVIDREYGPSRVTEDVPHAFLAQTLQHDLSSGHLHGGILSFSETYR